MSLFVEGQTVKVNSNLNTDAEKFLVGKKVRIVEAGKDTYIVSIVQRGRPSKTPKVYAIPLNCVEDLPVKVVKVVTKVV